MPVEKCAFCNKEGKEKTMLGCWVCGENHNATPSQVGTSPSHHEASSKAEEWENKFYEEFTYFSGEKTYLKCGVYPKILKDFISQEKERSRNEAIEECVNALEIKTGGYNKEEWHKGFDDAVTLAKESLLNLKKK